MSLLSRIFRPSTQPAEVRAEIWRLGVRHVGRPLEGALDTVDRQGSYGHTSLIPKLRTFRNMENV